MHIAEIYIYADIKVNDKIEIWKKNRKNDAAMLKKDDITYMYKEIIVAFYMQSYIMRIHVHTYMCYAKLFLHHEQRITDDIFRDFSELSVTIRVVPFKFFCNCNSNEFL